MSGNGDQVLLVSNGITNELRQAGHATNLPACSRWRLSRIEHSGQGINLCINRFPKKEKKHAVHAGPWHVHLP